jgi:hypothetical protein
MFAHPPVDLPKVYRPLGASVVASVAGFLLLFMATFLWLMLPDRVQDRFTPFQRVTLVIVVLAIVFVLYGLARTKVRADEAGLTITNGFHVHRYEWAELARITLTRGQPWAVIDLTDGTVVKAMALQAADGERASRQVRELAGVLASRTRTDRDD